MNTKIMVVQAPHVRHHVVVDVQERLSLPLAQVVVARVLAVVVLLVQEIVKVHLNQPLAQVVVILVHLDVQAIVALVVQIRAKVRVAIIVRWHV